MPRISKAKQEETRRAIVREARALFFSRGFDQTSTREVSRNVGIAEGTLFNYFQDKNALFLAAATVGFDAALPEVSELTAETDDAPDAIHAVVGHLYAPLLGFSKSMLAEFIASLVAACRKDAGLSDMLVALDTRHLDAIESVIRDQQRRGRLDAAADAAELSENVLAVFMFELLLYAYDSERSREEFLDRLKRKIASVCRGWMTS